MGAHIPKPWTVFRGQDIGGAIVVPDGTDPLDALIALVESDFGGSFSRENPVLVREAIGLKVQVWLSCSKAYREANVEDELTDDWWAPDGDGKRTVLVVAVDKSPYDIGEEAEAFEDSAP